MVRHYLSKLLAPRSVALVGATERPGALGSIVYRNLASRPTRRAVCGQSQAPHGLRHVQAAQGSRKQPMLRYPDAREVLVGVATDPVFGPVPRGSALPWKRAAAMKSRSCAD